MTADVDVDGELTMLADRARQRLIDNEAMLAAYREHVRSIEKEICLDKSLLEFISG